jgi:hypothetical protein
MSSPAPPPSLHEQAAGQAPPALKAAWLMGRDPVLRQQVWGVLFSSATYLLYGLITVVQVQFGFLSSRQAWILFAGSVVLNAVFYALVRSGWSARTADPGLARTQLLLGVGVMFIAYPFLGPAAPTMVIVMSSHIVYSMFGMPPRAVWRLVAASLAALAVTMVACHLAMPERYPVGTQLSAFLYALLVVPLIALLAGRVSAMTLRLQRQQEQLQQALAEVQALANRDELTRVHNRHGGRHQGQQAAALPSKPCAACGRPMSWRRRWARTWDEVKFCSDACRRAPKPAPVAELRHAGHRAGRPARPGRCAFDGFDAAQDAVWMAEVAEEATHVWSSKPRTVMFLAAMRHFATASRGRPLHYTRLDDTATAAALAAELVTPISAPAPRRLVMTAPGDWRVLQALKAWRRPAACRWRCAKTATSSAACASSPPTRGAASAAHGVFLPRDAQAPRRADGRPGR